MSFANFIRGIVRRNPELKLKLKKANSKQSSFQYVYQSIMMTVFSVIGLMIIVFLFTSKNLFLFLIAEMVILFASLLVYRFWFSVVDVEITKLGRELDADLLFVSEYFLVSIESGLPLGNAIENISRIHRPGGVFFKRIYTEFKTGKSFEDALEAGASFSASNSMKILIKRLKDSISIGVDLKTVLENFIEESSDKKLIEVKAFAKKLNPIVMVYLLLGIVLPSLGITFFILAAAMLEVTPKFLQIILIFVFLLMFGFQYFAYSTFKFSKSML